VTPDYEPAECQLIDGNLWVKQREQPGWMEMGIIPIPQSRWRVFLYHLCHGLLMHYPLHEVIWFSIRYCNPAEWRTWDGKEMTIMEDST